MQFKGTVKANLPSFKKIEDIDFTDVLLEVGEDSIAGQIRQNIRDGHDKDGKEFIPLADSTLRRKLGGLFKGKSRRLGSKTAHKLYGKANSPLIDTGELLNQSIGARVRARNEVAIFIYNPNRADIARYHQEGGANLPRRAFFGIPASEKGRIQRRANKLMRDKIKRALGK